MIKAEHAAQESLLSGAIYLSGGIIGTFFGLSTFLLVDVRIPILFCLLVAGLLGTARLSLGAHTPMQIYAGFLVGFLCEFLLLSI